MYKKAESVKFVVMVTAALILVGLAFVTFGKAPTITSKAVYTSKACYVLHNGKLTSADIVQCCTEIRKSQGCKSYNVEDINDEFFLCKGELDVVVNKDAIEFCG